MSLILDALNRADQERTKTDDAPSLSTVHSSGPSITSSPQNKYMLAAACLAVVISLLIVVYYIGKGSAETEDNTKPSAKVLSTAPSQEEVETEITPKYQHIKKEVKLREPNIVPANTQYKQKRHETPKSKKASKTITNLYANKERYEQRDEIQQTKAPPPEVNRAEQETTQNDNSDALEFEREAERILAELHANSNQQPQKTKPSTRITNPQPIKASAPQTTPKKIKTKKKTGPKIATIRDLPYSVQSKIPTIMYSAHNYNEGKRATVMLNKTRMKKGDKVTSGIRIVDIAPDGIILKYKSHKFKMNALSSWVNP